MVIGATPVWPVIFSFALLDRKIIDARDAQAHQATLVEFPVLVAIAAEPIPTVIVPFIGKADGDAIGMEGPDFLDQPAVELAVPLSRQKGFDRLSSLQKFGTVAPTTISGVGERDARGIARVPGILGQTRLLRGGIGGERRELAGGSWAFFLYCLAHQAGPPVASSLDQIRAVRGKLAVLQNSPSFRIDFGACHRPSRPR